MVSPPRVPGAAPLRVRERPSRLAGWVARPPVAEAISVGCTQGVDGDGVALRDLLATGVAHNTQRGVRVDSALSEPIR